MYGEVTTGEGHKLSYGGTDNKHEHGFLVHTKNIGSILGYTPVSSRIMSIRIKTKLFNFNIVQVYTPTTDHSDEEIEQFYDHLQTVKYRLLKKDIVIVQGDWNAKVGEDRVEIWKESCGKYSNPEINVRSHRLLEFASIPYFSKYAGKT